MQRYLFFEIKGLLNCLFIWCGSAQGIGGAWWFVEWNDGAAATGRSPRPEVEWNKAPERSGAPESPTPTAKETLPLNDKTSLAGGDAPKGKEK